MFRSAGIQARRRVITIRLNPLIFTSGNDIGFHSWTEVRYSDSNEWIPIDGYILDDELLKSAKKMLEKEQKTFGYFAHSQGQNQWDGNSKCMSQYVDDSFKEDGFEGVVDDYHDFLQSEKYPQRFIFDSWIGRTLFSWIFVPWTNFRISRVRSQ